jgi:hypothetical protein
MRPLTEGERNMAASIFGSAILYDAVTVKRRKWFPFQPRETLMAPTGHVHVHPASSLWSDDFSQERLGLQALFLHELTHVMRHPFCRYSYEFVPGRPFERYGLEQQGEIVRHTHLLRNRFSPHKAPPLQLLETILPFGRQSPLPGGERVG